MVLLKGGRKCLERRQAERETAAAKSRKEKYFEGGEEGERWGVEREERRGTGGTPEQG